MDSNNEILHINHKSNRGIDILYLHGELDARTSTLLEDFLKALLAKERRKIIINCDQLRYIASAGIGLFMFYIQKVRNIQGEIKLSNLQKDVLRVFSLVGFTQIYEIHHTEQDAIRQFLNS